MGKPIPDDKMEAITSPGRTERVNRAKFEAMWEALLAVPPDTSLGLRRPEAKGIIRHAP